MKKELDEYPCLGDIVCEMCGNQIDLDTSYCMTCKEFVGGEKICPECDGAGVVEVIDQRRINCRTIDIPYKKVTCPMCDGEGHIEL